MAPTSTDRNRAATAQKRRTTTRPNRAQLRAMEVRAAETRTAPAAEMPSAPGVSRRNKPNIRGFILTRDAEMRYVRADLRRLLIIAGVLFLLMIGLLLILN